MILESLHANRVIWYKSGGQSLVTGEFQKSSNLAIAIWSCLINLGLVLDLSPVFLSTRQMRALMVTSSAIACKWRMQEYPAQMIDFRSSITIFKREKRLNHGSKKVGLNYHLCIKHSASFNWVGRAAEHKTRSHVRFFDSFHLRNE